MAYPRKQTLVIFVICAVAVGGAALYVYRASSGSPVPLAPVSVAIGANSAEDVAPTASNWRAQFLGGASSTGSFATAQAASATSPVADDQPLTPTDIFGREFFTDYMQLHQAGLDTDTGAVSNMNDQLVSDSVQNIPAPTTYTESDLHVVAENDPASLQAYAAAVLNVLNTDVPDQDHNEAILAEQALEQSDMSQLKKLDPVISNYQIGLSTMLAMDVPGPLVQYHLEITNGIAISLYNAQALRKVDTDPLSSLGAVSLETAGLQSMDNGLTGLMQYFAAAGIPFNS